MQIRHLEINNFRAIASLSWTVGRPFNCVIGSGDSGKSTILDAIEATLSSRWYNFAESDFHLCDSSKPIKIEVTVGELSKQILSDERFGLFIRGWSPDNLLKDEPEDGDEPVVTVRLTVDATLEPVWDLVCERTETSRVLSNRDRSLFGLIRLAGDDSRHLSWGQGSVLSRLTSDKDEAANSLSLAYRAARDSAGLDKIESLTSAAGVAEGFAKALGAYVNGKYVPGLELGRSSISSGSIALHDGNVPLRLAGLGTKRLVTLAIQRSAIIDGAIILIDELEHGLEPHRIMGAISQLKLYQCKLREENKSLGQIILTTHSDIALAESGADTLWVCHLSRPTYKAELIAAESSVALRDLVRYTPRAFLARKILLAEGPTEVGLINGLKQFWLGKHDGNSFEQNGSIVVDGNGSQIVARACALAQMGYIVSLFRDSDKDLDAAEVALLTKMSVSVFQYSNNKNTEQAIFAAAQNNRVQEILEFVRSDDDSVNQSIMSKIPSLTLAEISQDYDVWSGSVGADGVSSKNILATLAIKNKWIKDSLVSFDIAPIVWSIMSDSPTDPLAVVFEQIEVWLYA